MLRISKHKLPVWNMTFIFRGRLVEHPERKGYTPAMGKIISIRQNFILLSLISRATANVI